METEFMLFDFPLKADTEKVPENLHTELINLQCDKKPEPTFPEIEVQDLHVYVPK
jgi:hypothetical protein